MGKSPPKTILKLIGTAAAAMAAAAPAAPADQPAFVPVFADDFADPFVLKHQGEYLAYSTNKGANLPMAFSRDLVTWKRIPDAGDPKKLHDAFPQLGAWAREGLTWAPEILKVGGRWILYYTARDRRKDKQCVGMATAADPRGPFRDLSAEPLVCQAQFGGTIDAHPFRDADGALYLYYKNDGNSVRKPTHIWGQRLSADGTALVGEPVALAVNDKAWEAHVIEAPTMVRRPGGYTLLYSGNHYGWEQDQRLSPYAMGYATCTGPLGPCTDGPDNPILYSYNDKSAGCLSGPGHQTYFEAGGRGFIAFHAWSATKGCRPGNGRRYLYIAPIGWSGGKPVIAPSLRPTGEKPEKGR